ncbi:MAG: transglutaminase-like domain-containing protein [Gemmatimonadota bacterium]
MAVAILGTWAGTLGWLAWRVYHRGSRAFTTGAVTILPPDTYFFSIEVDREQIGIATITVDTLTDSVRITEQLGFDLPIQRTRVRTQYTTTYTLGTDLALHDFRLSYPGRAGPVIQQGTLEDDSILVITPGTGEPSRRVQVGATPLIPPMMATVALALQQRLQTGEHTRIGIFDLTTLARDTVDLTVQYDTTFLVPDSAEYVQAARTWTPVHSDTMRAWRVAWRDSRRSIGIWVDSRGLPITIEAPSGLSFNRSAFEIVSTNYRMQRAERPQPPPGNVIPRTIVADGLARGAPIPEMAVQVSGNGYDWSPGPDSLAQPGLSVSRGGIQVHMVSLDSSSDTGSVRRPPGSSRWLRGDGMMILDDPQLLSRVRSIVGEATAPDRIARALVEWVARNIAATADPVLAPASTVLRTRQADVDGHTLLYVAMARAAGIPARPVSGLLLVNGQFYYHSWAEVFLNRWIPVDPTWNQFPADAGRLRLLVDGYARPLDLLPMAAGLEVNLNAARP